MGFLHHIAAYVLILAVVIFIHELGHYLACKWFGIEVETFSLGFGPILASATFWNTLWTLRLIPLGGFIKPAGIDKRPEKSKKNEYFGKAWYKRLVVAYAGPAMNFVLAFAIFVGLLVFRGMPQYSKASVIGEVQAGSLAEKVGLLPGDRIFGVNKEFVKSWAQMSYKIANSVGPLDLAFFRNNDLIVAHIEPGTPRVLGISPEVIVVRQSFFTAVKDSARICTFQVTETTKLLAAKLSHGDKTQFMGPIGIFQAVAQASSDLVETLSLMAILSLSIGIFNLLPIPLLDGGWGLLFIWEGITRKYPSAKAIYAFQLVGIAFLGLFLLYASCGDVLRLMGH